MSLEDDQTPQHFLGPATSVSSLAGALGPTQPAVAQNQYSNCPAQPCRYPRDDGNECGVTITCGNAPKHFSDVHNIKGMGRDVMIVCQWPKCNVKIQRHNFTRHLRNIHMGHPRD